jgi:hypothetical protein
MGYLPWREICFGKEACPDCIEASKHIKAIGRPVCVFQESARLETSIYDIHSFSLGVKGDDKYHAVIRTSFGFLSACGRVFNPIDFKKEATPIEDEHLMYEDNED